MKMLMTADQVAHRLGVHPSTVRRWLRTRDGLPKPLPVRAVDGGPLWLSADFEKWVAGILRHAKPAPDLVEPEARLRLVR